MVAVSIQLRVFVVPVENLATAKANAFRHGHQVLTVKKGFVGACENSFSTARLQARDKA